MDLTTVFCAALSFDLVGLLGDIREVHTFENDRSPAALDKVVDRLLASPHYGQLGPTLASTRPLFQYSKGYVFTEERRYPFSYTYRDYVIDAFHKPDFPLIGSFPANSLPPCRLDLQGKDLRPWRRWAF